MFDSLKITTSYLSFLLFLVHRTVLLNVKNFRESYVFHCLVIKVSVFATAFIIYHIFKTLSTTFLSFLNLFFKAVSITFPMFCRLADDLHTLSCYQSFVKLYFKFSEILFICLNSRNIYLRQLDYITIVKSTCQHFFHILFNYFSFSPHD